MVRTGCWVVVAAVWLAAAGCGGGGGGANPGPILGEDAGAEATAEEDGVVLPDEAPGEDAERDPGTAEVPGDDPGTPPGDPGTPPEDPGVAADPGAADPGVVDPGTVDPGTSDPGTAADTGPKSPVGGPCAANGDCAGTGAECIPAVFSDGSAGWPNGYCSIFDCASAGCPAGSECYETSDSAGNALTLCLATCDQPSDCGPGYTCPSYGACVPGCTSDADCGDDETCQPDGLCVAKPCTAGSCGTGLVCENGQCVPDVAGGPGPGPGPDCTDLPPMDCTAGVSSCGQIVPFEPLTGPGYDNYPLNGECVPCTAPQKCDGNWNCSASGTLESQYRSYARRDMVQLIKWATAYVDCKSKSWTTGNGKPLGLGDMSEKNGAIPGTSISSPGHPSGTHTNGFDMDIAYFQIKPPDNHLRPICEHTLNGAEQYHCVKTPDNVDVWRTSLFLGALMQSKLLRVIGVDGKVGPLVEAAMPTLCANGWLPKTSCDKLAYKLAYATSEDGSGWFTFHHHHLHVSINATARDGVPSGRPCITADCSAFAPGARPDPAWDLAGRPALPRARVRVPAGLPARPY